MKIVFRLNYHTVPGQSIWLRYSIELGGSGIRFDQVSSLDWLSDQQWEATVELEGTGLLTLEYSYELRQSGNGVQLEEWLAPRVVELDLGKLDALLLLDSWCSAGSLDYVFETNAITAVTVPRGPFVNVIPEADANHSFQLRMAAVPVGLVPCIIGGVKEIGDWGWQHALPLREVASNVWRVDLYLPSAWAVEYKYGLFDSAINCMVSLELGENRCLPVRVHGERQLTRVSDECYHREAAGLFRGVGVAIPVFSLRSGESLGVGEFADLKPMADWASGVGIKLIQILPINDTTSAHDWTDSYPYSAISVFALHPIYLRIGDLDFEMSITFGAEVQAAREVLNPLERVDYEAVMKVKSHLTRQIYDKHSRSIDCSVQFLKFLEMNRSWVVPYAVFCVKRDCYGTADFSCWEEWAEYDEARVHAFADCSHPDWSKVAYHIWLQYELDRQLADAVAHLHGKGLVLKGDLPIGIDRFSVDAWSAPHLFKMDSQAGAPPDAFALKGQNWGFPTYHWEVMKRDDYAWWRSRFAHLSRYFDAYRIDHILGFFRIWQVPYDQVEGIMGFFDPALPIHIDEIRRRGIDFDYNRFCRPYIREHSLSERFGDAADEVKGRYLHDCGYGYWQLREHVATQRRIMDHFAALPEDGHHGWIREGLLDCASDVLFFEVAGSDGTLFHPRCSMQTTRSYQELELETRLLIEDLYLDYFYRRQEDFWQARGYERLPAMRGASRMLLCGEDLGMVPACVPGVLRELGILSLEIQRMPKTSDVEFYDPGDAPFMSVVSPSTHDMSTLRGWWREDPEVTRRFARRMLGIDSAAAELSGELAARIIIQHLQSAAMWAVFPLQDLLAIDGDLRHPVPEFERINVPAIIPYYWRYRMHLNLEDLAAAEGFNRRIARFIQASHR
jgi:4-alpha-glucanotransferase